MRISITFVTSAVALLTSVAYAAPQPVADTSVYKRQTGGLTPDGTCGGTARYRCPTTGNRCCSQHGWCGSSVDHCGKFLKFARLFLPFSLGHWLVSRCFRTRSNQDFNHRVRHVACKPSLSLHHFLRHCPPQSSPIIVFWLLFLTD